jgi:hypothetical protein
MIQIDDSGWGCLLGGVMIGVYDTNSKKFKAKLIPTKFFQKTFKGGAYRDEALKAALLAISSMGFRPSGKYLKGQSIMICRGTCLDGIYDYFDSKFNTLCLEELKREEILNPLQSMLEEEFAQSLIKIGVPRKTTGAHCLTFDDQVKWAKEDKANIKHVKTGWTSWQNKYSKSTKT